MQSTDPTVEAKMLAPGRTAVYAVIAWTLFMWTTRLRLIFTETDLSFGDIVLRVAPVFVFVAMALVLVSSVRVGRPDLARSVAVVAAWTTAYWLIRITAIMFRDHDLGFKVVHAVLAVMSIGTAVWAWRRTSPRYENPAGAGLGTPPDRASR